MKRLTMIVVVCSIAVAIAGCRPKENGVTADLDVYTDVTRPKGTSHYYATRLTLSIRDGRVVDCRKVGTFDLFTGERTGQ